MTACKNKVYSILGFKMRLNWLQTHHLYWGLILMALAGYWALSDSLQVFGVAYALFALGLYVALDDIFQHHKQVTEFNPCYHSPVHRFIYDYLKLYDRAWFRALNKFADWLFKNPLMLAIVLCAIILVIIVLKG